MGLIFDDCKPILLSFEFVDCLLDFSSFQQMSIPDTVFRNCSMQEVIFWQSDISSSSFVDCNLAKATFKECNLKKSDFRGAQLTEIAPTNNQIQQAYFSMNSLPILLKQYDLNIEP
jgi:uncharacterized protein YjbI with pentapeptide repeats